jgi:hypothetical protein
LLDAIEVELANEVEFSTEFESYNVFEIAIRNEMAASFPIIITIVIATKTTINLSIALMFIECDTIAIFAFDSPGWLDLGLVNCQLIDDGRHRVARLI